MPAFLGWLYYNTLSQNMKPEIEAFVLAGGRGSRMGALTERTQKCLLPIDGRPTIGHVMERLTSAFGSVDLKVAISYKGDDVREYIERNKPRKIATTYISVPHGLNDYGAYMAAEEYIHGIFLALPGDIIIDPKAYSQIIELFDSGNADMTTTLSPLVNIADTHPVAKIQDLQVIEYIAKAPLQLDPDHLRDLMILASSPKLFHYMRLYPNPEGYLGSIVEKIVRNHQSLNGLMYESPWLHIGYPEDLLKHLPF